MNQIQLNNNFVLVKVNEELYKQIEKEKNKQSVIEIYGEFVKRENIIKGFKSPLIIYNKKHQSSCKIILGNGTSYKITRNDGSPYEEIPLHWVSYTNYKTDKLITAVANENEAMNGLSRTRNTAPVLSFNSALEALELSSADYAIIILTKQN
jgi:hypothetical protein